MASRTEPSNVKRAPIVVVMSRQLGLTSHAMAVDADHRLHQLAFSNRLRHPPTSEDFHSISSFPQLLFSLHLPPYGSLTIPQWTIRGLRKLKNGGK